MPYDSITMNPLTIGILADLPHGPGGGVNHFTRGVVRALISSPPEDPRIVVFVAADDVGWGAEPSEHVAFVEVQRPHRMSL